MMNDNKDQVIHNLKERVKQLEAEVTILKKNVHDEVTLSHELMKKVVNQITREVPKT